MENAVKKSESPLQIWDKVEIIVGEGREESVYVSRVEDINDGAITITKPNWVRGGQGLTYNSTVYIQFKKPDAMYRFAADMHPINGDSNLILLNNFGKTVRVQRRQFVRIRYAARLRYWLVKDHEGNFYQEESWKESLSEDISAGGILIRNISDIEPEDLLIMRIRHYDPMGIPPFLAGRCCRLTRSGEFDCAAMEFLTNENLKKYFSMEELNILPPHIQKFNLQVQNNLVRFIFEEQVKERQKGLL